MLIDIDSEMKVESESEKKKEKKNQKNQKNQKEKKENSTIAESQLAGELE